MRNTLGAIIFLLFIPIGHAEQRIDPALALVRIHSHGASGTVIWSKTGKSYILSCAHMFDGPDSLKKPLRIDGPRQPAAAKIVVKPKVLQVDFSADLSLIELANGPFYSVPVAPRGHQHSQKLWSIGYDNMRWPVTKLPATFLNTSPTTTYTRERPWHGRSGGGLFDAEKNYLVGVVQGYEVTGPRRGLYVSHAAVLRFLQKYRQLLLPPLEIPSPTPYSLRLPFGAPRSLLPAPGQFPCLPGGT